MKNLPLHLPPRRRPDPAAGASPRSPNHESRLEETPGSLRGLRVLVVEDDFLAALRLSRLLTELGCEVLGPAATPAVARRFMIHQPHAAVLDVNLGRETAFDLAGDLAGRDVRVLLVTAEPERLLPQQLQRYPLLSKPFSSCALASALDRAVT